MKLRAEICLLWFAIPRPGRRSALRRDSKSQQADFRPQFHILTCSFSLNRKNVYSQTISTQKFHLIQRKEWRSAQNIDLLRREYWFRRIRWNFSLDSIALSNTSPISRYQPHSLCFHIKCFYQTGDSFSASLFLISYGGRNLWGRLYRILFHLPVLRHIVFRILHFIIPYPGDQKILDYFDWIWYNKV